MSPVLETAVVQYFALTVARGILVIAECFEFALQRAVYVSLFTRYKLGMIQIVKRPHAAVGVAGVLPCRNERLGQLFDPRLVQCIDIIEQPSLRGSVCNERGQLFKDLVIFQHGRVVRLQEEALVGKQIAAEAAHHVQNIALKPVAVLEYRAGADQYLVAGIDLLRLPVVDISSYCKQQQDNEEPQEYGVRNFHKPR